LHKAHRSIRFISLDVVVTPKCLSTGCGLSTQVRRTPSTGIPQDGGSGLTGVTQVIEVAPVVRVDERGELVTR
jgi:hypothetical protein